MQKKYDVAVIGGGSVGLCTAYFLQKSGKNVVVIDKALPGSADQCSYANAGYVAPSHIIPLASPGIISKGLRWMLNPDSPFYIHPRLDWQQFKWMWTFWRSANLETVQRAIPILAALCNESANLYNVLAEDKNIGDFGLEKQGLLMLYNTEKAFAADHKIAETAIKAGVPTKLLNPQEIKETEPAFETTAVGAIYYTDDWHIRPSSLCQQLHQALAKNGVDFIEMNNSLTFEKSDGKLTKICAGENDINADEFVLASGAWTPQIAGTLGIRLPIQAGKGYSVTVKNSQPKAKVPAILTETKVAVTPYGDEIRFAGTLEFNGLNTDINPRRVRAILNAVSKYITNLDMEEAFSAQPWAGLRPCSPDGLPLIGRTEKYNNLIIAAGHAMVGITLAPVTGKIVSEIVADEKPSVELDLLQPDRF
ncbi:MAG: FAD-dependent oxidoreductase [Calditrichaeota bacterium]|nr:MAG: FAD-dependent oxidoreductase [Calditrichota bacterium]